MISIIKTLLFCLRVFNDQQDKPEDLTRYSDYAVGRRNYEFGVIIRAMTLIYVIIKFFNLCLVPIQAYLNIPVLCHSQETCTESWTLHNSVNCSELGWSCSLESLGWKLASDNGASLGKGRENDSEASTEPNDTNNCKINSFPLTWSRFASFFSHGGKYLYFNFTDHFRFVFPMCVAIRL